MRKTDDTVPSLSGACDLAETDQILGSGKQDIFEGNADMHDRSACLTIFVKDARDWQVEVVLNLFAGGAFQSI